MLVKDSVEPVIPDIRTSRGLLCSDADRCGFLLGHFLPLKSDEKFGLTSIDKASLPSINFDMVDNFIKQLKNKKAAASDKINNKIVKFINLNFPSLFVTLFQKCITLQIFPRCWKVANIKLLSKPGKDRSLN